MGWLKKILFKQLHIFETEIECQCGRKNEVMITMDLLKPHPADSNELRAWKMRQWDKLIKAEKWYRDRKRTDKKT